MTHRVEKFRLSGFTLVEMLAVMIIVGMMSTIFLQALDRVYRLQNRFGVELFNAQRGAMSIDWFRQTVQGLLPDYYSDGANKFSGSTHEFSGLSTNPLSEEYGAATGIKWKITFDQNAGKTQLIYIDSQDESVIAEWQGGTARFIYVDDKLEQHESWPPRLGMWPQLPKLIRLEIVDAADPLVIAATPLGSPVPPPESPNFLGAPK